jgi:hypothetical protein
MVQAEAILIDDETDPRVQALEGRTGRFAVVFEDGSMIELGGADLNSLRRTYHVRIDHAATLIGAAPAAVEDLIESGELDALRFDGQVYLSLHSVMDYTYRQTVERRRALADMIRVSEEGGLYDAESEAS